MAVDMFLEFEGDIKGETLDSVKSSKFGIDITSFNFGATNSGTTHIGGGGGSGKVNIQDISVTKWVDKASHSLFRSVCDGTHYPKAIITLRKAGGAKIEYLVITMEEVLVTSYQVGGSSADDRTMESISLNFGKVTYQYTPQKQDGTADTAIPYTWDIAKQVQG